MQQLHSWVGALAYPPVLSAVALSIAGLLLLLHRRRVALVMASVGVAWSLLWSLPVSSEWLRQSLERREPVVDETRLPTADAIVVLGGGAYEYLGHTELGPEDLANSRLAAGARAWRAGRAPLIILSGGSRGTRPGLQTEARRMQAVIRRWGVPPSALLLEERSHDTRDNAFFTAQLARDRHLQRVLLVTSALHMPRASRLFRDAGVSVVPVSVPEPGFPALGEVRPWLPARGALWRSGRALKEYAGLVAVVLQDDIRRPAAAPPCGQRGQR